MCSASPARRAALLAGLGAFALYFASLPATVSLDSRSPSLACAADTLGIANPPGYPTWTMLGWLFCRAFAFVSYHGHSNPAWATNLFSAVCGAGACAIWAALAARILPPRLSAGLRTGLGAAFALHIAFNRACWGEVVITETTGFHLLLWSAFLAQLIRTDEQATGRRCLVVGLLAASTLLASYSFVVALPLLLALWLRRVRRHGAAAPAGWFLIGFALGLLPLLYLPLAAAHNPPFNWGAAYTWEGFLHLVLRGQYEQVIPLSPFREPGRWLGELAGWGALAREFLGWPVLLAAALGLLASLRAGPARAARAWLAFALLLYTGGLALALPAAADLQTLLVALPLWTPSLVLVTLLAAAGFGELLGGVGRPALRHRLALAAAVLLIALPLWRNARDDALIQRWGASDRVGWFAIFP